MTSRREMMWYTALATYGVGDIATTHKGLQIDGVEETHPLGEEVHSASGTSGLVGVKAMAFTGAGLLYKVVPDEYRAGIPIGLSLIGTYATMKNIQTINKAEKAQE